MNWIRRPWNAVIVATAVVLSSAAITIPVVTGGGGPTPGCTGADVTTATWAARIAAAANGDTLCLSQTAYYGSWTGRNFTSPGITVKAKPGAGVVPKMMINFSTGANWITMDGIYIGQGTNGDHRVGIDWGASHITLKNAEVGAWMNVETSTLNMSLTLGPGLIFTYSEDPTGQFIICDGCHNEGRLFINGDPGGNDGQTPTGLLVTGDTFRDNCADGLQANTGGFTVTDSTFTHLRQASCDPHVDSVAFYAGSNGAYYNAVFTRNVFTDSASGIVDYDSSAHAATVTNNGFYNVPSSNDGFFNPCGAICLKGSVGEIVSHNTVRPGPGDTTHNKVQIGSNNQGGGSTGAHVFDNVLENDVSTNGSFSFTADHNFCATGTCAGTGSLSGAPAPSFVGTPPVTLGDFALTPGTRGTGLASDGTNMGVNP